MKKWDKFFVVTKPFVYTGISTLCLGIGGILFTLVGGTDEGFHYNAVTSIIAGIPIMMSFLALSSKGYGAPKKEDGTLKNVLSFFGSAFLIVALICTAVLLGVMLDGKIDSWQDLNNFWVWMLFAASGHVLLCLIFIWTADEAKENTARVLNGRVFYAGQKFHVWPFRYYWQNEELEKTFSVSFRTKISSGPREVTFFFKPQYDFTGGRTSLIKKIDLKSIYYDVELALSGLILNHLKKLSAEDLLEGKTDPVKFDSDFPVVWDGQFTVLTH